MGKGRFLPGQSGNPGGRPKVPPEIRDMARARSKKAILALEGVLDAKDAPATAKVMAAEALLNRGWGKPAQTVEHSGPDGLPIELADMTDVEIARRIALVFARGDRLAGHAVLVTAQEVRETDSVSLPAKPLP